MMMPGIQTVYPWLGLLGTWRMALGDTQPFVTGVGCGLTQEIKTKHVRSDSFGVIPCQFIDPRNRDLVEEFEYWDPHWANWSPWSECTQSCGGGTRTRTGDCLSRLITLPKSSCPRQPLQRCHQQGCTALVNPAVEWGEWSTWSSCSSSCGPGSMNRQRSCSAQNGTQLENVLCGPMPGSSEDSGSCELGPCLTVEWGEWSTWSSCSSSCGPGSMNRQRSCSGQNGTQLENELCGPLPGSSNDSVSCDLGSCSTTLIPISTSAPSQFRDLPDNCISVCFTNGVLYFGKSHQREQNEAIQKCAEYGANLPSMNSPTLVNNIRTFMDHAKNNLDCIDDTKAWLSIQNAGIDCTDEGCGNNSGITYADGSQLIYNNVLQISLSSDSSKPCSFLDAQTPAQIKGTPCSDDFPIVCEKTCTP